MIMEQFIPAIRILKEHIIWRMITEALEVELLTERKSNYLDMIKFIYMLYL